MQEQRAETNFVVIELPILYGNDDVIPPGTDCDRRVEDGPLCTDRETEILTIVLELPGGAEDRTGLDVEPCRTKRAPLDAGSVVYR